MSSKYQPSRLAIAVGSALAVSSTEAATITVDTLDDPGGGADCSLRAAIESANTQSTVGSCDVGDGIDDTIVFESGLSGTIGLTDGELEVDADMHISGPGAENVTVDAGGDSRAFVVTGANATISGLTITGGGYNPYGGGVYAAYADLRLSDCVITGNSANYAGGGVDVWYGNLEVENCEISGNTSGVVGGGVAVEAGTAVVSGSTVTGNEADEAGGGLWVAGNIPPSYNGDAGSRPGGRGYGGEVFNTLTIVESTVSGNQAYSGGGVAAGDPYGGSSLLSLPDWRDADARGELLSRLAPPEGANIAGGPGEDDPNLIILDSTISANDATVGGGVMAASVPYDQNQPPPPRGGPIPSINSLRVEGSTIGENMAYLGGGVAAKYSNSYLLETGVVDNTAYVYGGGILNAGSPYSGGGAVVANAVLGSQISGNQVLGAPENRGGPFYGQGAGGGIFSVGALSYMADTEATGNTAFLGGGLANVAGLAYSYVSTFSGNQGGGMLSKYESETIVFGSRVQDNTGPWGGGMDCLYAQCAVMYSSVTGNQGGLVGGVNAGLYDTNLIPQGTRGVGPLSAVEIYSSTLSGNSGGVAGGMFSMGYSNLNHSTVADNHQDSTLIGDQQSNWDGDGGGVVTGVYSSVNHSIIAGNSAESGPNDLYVTEDFAPSDEISMDWSLVQDDSGFTPGGGDNIFNQDPLLGPLDFHGGSYSLAHSLPSGSPALDAGDPAIAEPPDYDQRGPGFDRVFNDRIDIGAFEGQGEPAISLSVASIDFGDVLIGADTSADVTVESAGSAALEIGEIEIPGLPAEFEIFDDNCSNVILAPTETCTFSVRFMPQAQEIYNEIASVPSNAPDTPAEVDLTGRGVVPGLTITPSSVDFGDVLVGSDDAALLTVESVGGGSLTIGQINLGLIVTGALQFKIFDDNCSNVVLAPSEQCTLGVRFQPPSRGFFGADVSIPSDAPDSPAGALLEGAGVAPELTIDPALIDFGDVEVGTNSPDAFVELSNSGDAVLNLADIDAPAAPFAGAGGNCSIPGSLDVGDSCTLGFNFSPTEEGEASQTFIVDSDSLGGDSSFALQGNGTSEPPPPPAVAIPVMSRLTTLLLGGGLLLLGLFGLRRRLN